jgi:hypothetical protein
MSRAPLVACAACAFAFAPLAACGAKHAPAAGHGALGGEVARVGDTPIAGEVVASVAAERGGPVRSALDAVVDDALLAQGARVRGLAEQPGTRGALASALAARVLAAIARDAQAQGPPTAAERAELQVVHALAVRGPNLSVPRALELANEIQAAVAGAPTPDAFEERARAVPHAGVRLVVERLGPFAAAGLLPDRSMIDRTFVAAAFALRDVGDTSPVVETPFGWHTIRLIERASPSSAADGGGGGADEAADVVDVRSRIALERVLLTRRQAMRVEQSAGIDDLLGSVRVTVSTDSRAANGAVLP